MNASRGFPPYSQCHFVSARNPVPASSNRVLAGADCMKKLSSDTDASGTGRSSTSASIMSRKAERSWRKARMSGRSPSGTRARSTRHQACAPRSVDRRSSPPMIRRRDGIDQIHRDNGLADHSEAPATGTGRGTGIIDIRDFDECHEFFETFDPLPWS